MYIWLNGTLMLSPSHSLPPTHLLIYLSLMPSSSSSLLPPSLPTSYVLPTALLLLFPPSSLPPSYLLLYIPAYIDTPGSSSSVIIIYQLEDKLQAHCRYTQFITDIGLLDKVVE